MWHLKLGHPSLLALRKVFDSLHLKYSNSYLSFCDACKLGKLHQLPFQHSTFKDSSTLELMFTYVWGPFPLLSLEGHRYYVIFVDSYSRYSWLFLLKLKSEV